MDGATEPFETEDQEATAVQDVDSPMSGSTARQGEGEEEDDDLAQEAPARRRRSRAGGGGGGDHDDDDDDDEEEEANDRRVRSQKSVAWSSASGFKTRREALEAIQAIIDLHDKANAAGGGMDRQQEAVSTQTQSAAREEVAALVKAKVRSPQTVDRACSI